MTKSPLGSLLGVSVLAAVAAGCYYDARGPYLGTYAVSTLAQTTANGTTTNSTVSGTLDVTEAPNDSRRIVLTDGSCVLTGLVTADSFSVDVPVSCSASTTSTTGVPCNEQITFSSGSGSRTPGSISVSVAGAETYTCNDGSSGQATVTEDISGTLQ